jgi:hypothetical protein
MALKMRSGVGLEADVDVAISLAPLRDLNLPVSTDAGGRETLRGESKRFASLPGTRSCWHTFSPRGKQEAQMKREYQRWYSQRLGLELGVVIYGHWGAPLLGFPTSAGDEWELEGQGMVDALGDFLEGGKV